MDGGSSSESREIGDICDVHFDEVLGFDDVA